MSHTLERKRWLIIISMVLVLAVVPLLTACDDDDETTSATSQPTTTTSAQSTNTQPTTVTPTDKPVKIGVVAPWSGPSAMMGTFYVDQAIKVIEKQLEDMGGILGGRPVEFVRCDMGNITAGAVSCAEKLVTKDNVSALAVGGVGTSSVMAIADVAAEEKVLYASVCPVWKVPEYTVVCSMSILSTVEDPVRLLLEVVTPRPKTAGLMTFNEPDSRRSWDTVRQRLEAAGIEVVYEEYVNHDVVDFSPYLTKIKYEDPDYLIVSLDSAQYMAIAKQIMDLGGWGDIHMAAYGTASAAARMPGAQGWIVMTSWDLSKTDPESIKFKEDFKAVNGKLPTDMHVYFYITLWTAIHAIEQAGTDDPEAIGRFARSGNLEFDTPMGRATFGTDGNNSLRNIFVQIQKGGVYVPFPQ